jgi:hypothetical protein
MTPDLKWYGVKGDELQKSCRFKLQNNRSRSEAGCMHIKTRTHLCRIKDCPLAQIKITQDTFERYAIEETPK